MTWTGWRSWTSGASCGQSAFDLRAVLWKMEQSGSQAGGEGDSVLTMEMRGRSRMMALARSGHVDGN